MTSHPDPFLEQPMPSLLTQVSIIHIWIHPGCVDEGGFILWCVQKGSTCPVKAPHRAQQGTILGKGDNRTEEERKDQRCPSKKKKLPWRIWHKKPLNPCTSSFFVPSSSPRVYCRSTHRGDGGTETFLRHLMLKRAGTSCLSACREEDVLHESRREAWTKYPKPQMLSWPDKGRLPRWTACEDGRPSATFSSSRKNGVLEVSNFSQKSSIQIIYKMPKFG